jgi:hypothetical protein
VPTTALGEPDAARFSCRTALPEWSDGATPPCRATRSYWAVLPHPGMLPNGLGIASPECSRRGVTLSIGIQRVLPEIWHMLAAA